MPRLLLISLASLGAALSMPAYALPIGSPPSGVQVHVGNVPGKPDRPRRGPTLVYGFGSPEGWAYYNNRSFESDSYNDWWHDRPDRSMPRWLSRNSGCERMYWTGAGWRC